MKLRNKSETEAKVMNEGQGFAVAPGGTSPELADVCAKDLLKSFPSVWELAPVSPSKKKKEGNQ